MGFIPLWRGQGEDASAGSTGSPTSHVIARRNDKAIQEDKIKLKNYKLKLIKNGKVKIKSKKRSIEIDAANVGCNHSIKPQFVQR